MIISDIFSVLIGYLLGSICSAVLLSKIFYGKDVRESGSGNAGATNAARVFGWGMGLSTLFFDGLKMALALYAGQLLAGRLGWTLAGIACLVGHCWPAFFRFRGGKGVSTAAMIALAVDWRAFLICLGIFVVIFLCTHRVSVCSVVSALCVPAVEALFRFSDWYGLFLTAGAALLVLVQHRSNLKRLVQGKEPRFTLGKVSKEEKQQ